jgi:hypothetical protein
MEFNAIQIASAHRIHLELLSRFYTHNILSIHDPNKLNQIWNAKLDKRAQRHKEVMLSTLNEFYDIDNEISDKYNVMRGHIKRLQKSVKIWKG